MLTTNMPHVSRVMKALGGSWLSRGIGMEVDGVAGALILLWNEDQFMVKVCIINKQYVVLIGELTVKSFLISWCMGGDFNSVLDPSERVGAGCNMSSVRNFNAFILEAKLLDLPLHGSLFMWINSRAMAA
ncbi:hypothetical protein Q3G72_031471 [Acer saccharum]|nr:hypothetical protein Q3G72_031471 [Acer saccharum]